MKTKKKLMGRMVQVVLRIPPGVEDKVQAIAKRECRSYSSVLRQAITEWLASRPVIMQVRVLETPKEKPITTQVRVLETMPITVRRPRKSNR